MKYEYRYVWVPVRELEQTLEMYGASGWRLHTCSFDTHVARVSLVWEREVESQGGYIQ